MAKADAADKLRKQPGFAPVWSDHAGNERLPEYLDKYGLDKLSCERIVRTGHIGTSERNLRTGRENVHVRGTVDGMTVDVVVDPQSFDGAEYAVIVTIKPKPKSGK